jgi:hypothetical protein
MRVPPAKKKKEPEKRWNASWDPQPPVPIPDDQISRFRPCEANRHWIATFSKKCMGCELGAPENLTVKVFSDVQAVPQRAVPKGRPIEDLPEL